MKPEIVEAREEHIEAVAAHVRRPDRLELFLSSCDPPAKILRRSFQVSRKVWTGLIDGVPVCMFGVVPGATLGDVGRPWLVGTDALDRHPFIFLRRCKGCVREMLEDFSTLENYVHQDNDTALRWLIWLGFTITIPGEPMGPFGAPFCRFEMRRDG